MRLQRRRVPYSRWIDSRPRWTCQQRRRGALGEPFRSDWRGRTPRLCWTGQTRHCSPRRCSSRYLSRSARRRARCSRRRWLNRSRRSFRRRTPLRRRWPNRAGRLSNPFRRMPLRGYRWSRVGFDPRCSLRAWPRCCRGFSRPSHSSRPRAPTTQRRTAVTILSCSAPRRAGRRGSTARPTRALLLLPVASHAIVGAGSAASPGHLSRDGRILPVTPPPVVVRRCDGNGSPPTAVLLLPRSGGAPLFATSDLWLLPSGSPIRLFQSPRPALVLKFRLPVGSSSVRFLEMHHRIGGIAIPNPVHRAGEVTEAVEDLLDLADSRGAYGDKSVTGANSRARICTSNDAAIARLRKNNPLRTDRPGELRQ